jgi:hypothetical protein
MKTISNAVTQTTKYGYYTPMGFNNTKWRLDKYKSNETQEETIEMVAVKDTNDLSPVVTAESGKYGAKSDCYCCYVGITHSVNRCKD